MKAAAIALIALLMLSGVHIPVWFAGGVRSVPVPVLALVLVIAVLAVLTVLIVRTARRDGFGIIPCVSWSVTP